MDLLRQRQDLPREVEQFDVLLLFLLNRCPLLIGNHLVTGVGAVLRDQNEGREEDRFE